MKFLIALIACFLPVTSPVAAQSLTPEEIAAMIDKKVSNLNPYQALLNDADPERGRLAMEIMLESGDPELMRMALEFGLLSPNPTVKRTAFEAWLKSGPILSVRFDGTNLKDAYFSRTVTGYWNGTQSDGIGYWRIPVGPYLPEQKCFSNTTYTSDCFITVNSDGVFLTPRAMNARAIITEAGALEGTGTLTNVGDAIPFSVQLID